MVIHKKLINICALKALCSNSYPSCWFATCSICSTPGLCCRGVEVGLGFKPQGARRRAARLPFLSEKRETNSFLESESLFHHVVFAFIMYTYIYIYTYHTTKGFTAWILESDYLQAESSLAGLHFQPPCETDLLMYDI